jgi:hypothetical protein
VLISPPNLSAFRLLFKRGLSVLVPDERPKFLDPATGQFGDPPLGSLLAYVGPHHDRFAAAFGQIGYVGVFGDLRRSRVRAFSCAMRLDR